MDALRSVHQLSYTKIERDRAEDIGVSGIHPLLRHQKLDHLASRHPCCLIEVRVEAVRTLGDSVICAFNRDFAGNEQVAAAVLDRRSGRPRWFREAGAGNFIYLYQLDGVVVLHNVGLDVEACTWGFRIASGKLVFRVTGLGADAELETYDAEEQPVGRSRP